MNADQPAVLTRAVVTGAAGFIGSHLVRHLRNHGADVWGIDRSRRSGTEDVVDEVADVSFEGVIDAHLDERTVLFHMAGSADVRGSVEEPAHDFTHNVVPTLRALEAVRRCGASMIFPSSGSVYDPAGALPFREDSPVRPSSPYGAGKVSAEAYCAAYHRTFEVDLRVARIFSVFGPGMRRFAIYDFCERLQAEPDRLVIFGDGRQTRHFIYVEDVARALAAIAERGSPGETYNVAAGQPMRMLDVAREVARAMGLKDSDVVPDSAEYAAELDRMEADLSRMSRLDLESETPFREGLQATVRFLTSPDSPCGSPESVTADPGSGF